MSVKGAVIRLVRNQGFLYLEIVFVQITDDPKILQYRWCIPTADVKATAGGERDLRLTARTSVHTILERETYHPSALGNEKND
ncbi:hypothetical protein BJY04DRAFT_214508 [Aspergillus karnatakaensis]|uniref:uncharacterized protein n=1 Tax=Aspergillus karnatakaensis TaxID=1810916 RepID=UPI003CCDD5EA